MARNRFTNIITSNSQEADGSLIYGYQHLPIVTLEEAIEKIVPLVPGIVEYVSEAKKNCDRNTTLLTWNESAAIYLYSMSIPFFSHLNIALRAKSKYELKRWFPFLKLLITALEKLSPTKATLWRGVNYDDTLTFIDNDTHIWWGVTSCSMNPKTVQPFLGETGTLFVIDAISGKDISTFSAFPDEQEVILMPGTRLRAKSESLSVIDRLFVVHLEEENLQRLVPFRLYHLLLLL